MARKTIAGLEAELERLKDHVAEAAGRHEKAQRSIREMGERLKAKDEEIHKLRVHVGFVHSQRDRLVGFIEGQRSITEPQAVRVTENSYQPTVEKLGRTEKFLDECTLKFEGTPDLNVSNDPFRHNRRF